MRICIECQCTTPRYKAAYFSQVLAEVGFVASAIFVMANALVSVRPCLASVHGTHQFVVRDPTFAKLTVLLWG